MAVTKKIRGDLTITGVINGITLSGSSSALTVYPNSTLRVYGGFEFNPVEAGDNLILRIPAGAGADVTLPLTGTLGTLAGSESLTNKKLGSLTTNGLVQTSASDGTLSVLVPGTGVATALGNTLNAASGLVGFNGNIGAATASGNLIFSPTNTYNIGAASGVTCPKHIYVAGEGITSTGNIEIDNAVAFYWSTRCRLRSSGTGTVLVQDSSDVAFATLSSSGNIFTSTVTIGGSATLGAKAGGTIKDFSADVGNGTTVETDLFTFTTLASTLGTNNDKLEAQYAGVFVSSGTATRQLKIYFAGTAIFDSGALMLSLSSTWDIYVEIIRVSSTIVRASVSMTTQGAALAAYTNYTELTSLTLSSTNILKITGTAAGVGAATNDIVAKLGTIKWMSAA